MHFYKEPKMSELFNTKEIKEKIIQKLKNIYDPEIPVNIYDLGLIYSIELETKENYLHCMIDMTLTSPSCPVADALVDQVQYVAQSVDEVDEARVNLTFNPPWDKSKLTEEGREMMILSGAII